MSLDSSHGRAMKFGMTSKLVVAMCLGTALGIGGVQAGEPAVDFTAGDFGGLVRFLGPSDSPRDQRPEYTVVVVSGRAVHLAPAAASGPRLTGLLEPAQHLKPLPADITIEWRLPDVGELQALAPSGGFALAGHYIRGAYDFAARQGDWQGGLFSDWWGAVFKQGDTLLAVLRNGNRNAVAVPIRARTSIAFRLVKEGSSLSLWLSEDESGWQQAAQATIGINPGGKASIAMSHFRVLETSGAAVRMSVDRMRWSSPDAGWPR